MHEVPQVLHSRTRWVLALAAPYALALVLIAFWPTPVDAAAGPTLTRIIDWLHGHGVPAWFGYGEIEFGANIVYFLPLGLLASWWWGAWWTGLFTGVLISLVIETGQLLMLPDRVPSARDLLANSLGTALGVLLWALGSAWLRRGTARLPRG